MRTVELPGGGTGQISEVGDPVDANIALAEFQRENTQEPGIVVDDGCNCNKSRTRHTDRSNAIKAGTANATHTVSVLIDGVPGKIPFIPNR